MATFPQGPWHQRAASDVRVATALDRDCEATCRTLARGSISPAQAQVITGVIATLPSSVGDHGRRRAGTPMSAAQARRLACSTEPIPMVLGGDSCILDLGRSERLHNRYQRIAMGKREGGCIWPGCDRPPSVVRSPPHHPLVSRR